jgi:hypothetical protein
MDRTQLVDGLSRTIYRTGVGQSGLHQHSSGSGHLVIDSDLGSDRIGIPPLTEEGFYEKLVIRDEETSRFPVGSR